ncbi:MAG: Spy/CpxP family protein refolding chaperone [Muribaculaceae bacterium]
MRKLFLSLCFILLGLAAVSAQPKFTDEQREQFFNSRVKMIQDELKLSDEQTEQMSPIYKKYLEKVRSVKFPKHPGKEGFKSSDEACNHTCQMLDCKKSIIDAQKQLVKDLRSVLNPDQLSRFLGAEGKIHEKIRHQLDRERNKVIGDPAKRKMRREQLRKETSMKCDSFRKSTLALREQRIKAKSDSLKSRFKGREKEMRAKRDSIRNLTSAVRVNP